MSKWLILFLLFSFNAYCDDADMDQLDPDTEASDRVEATNENFRKLKDTQSDIEEDVDTNTVNISTNEGKFMCNSSDSLDYWDGQVDGTSLIDDSGTAKVGNPLGSWASKSVDTNYEASTDGIACGVYNTGSSNCLLIGYTDSNSTPTTIVTRDASSSETSERRTCGICFPVAKGDYWRIADSGATADAIYWLPLGN